MAGSEPPASSEPALSRLDTRIPPPVVMAACAVLAWAAARWWNGPSMPACPPLAALLVLAGLLLNLEPKRHYRRAGTSVNPLRPSAATRLMQHDLYRLSRNPMYLGHATLLLGVAVLLHHPAALTAAPAYVAYITRFQILAEERALRQRFGEDYRRYCAQVRRWL